MPTRRTTQAANTRRRSTGVAKLLPAHTEHSVRTGPHNPDALMNEALGNVEISLNIPDTASLSQVEETLAIAVDGHQRLIAAAERLKPFIGRILLHIKSRSLFKPGCNTWTEYKQSVSARYGISNTSLDESLQIAKAFPTMDPKEYIRVGASRLLQASRITDETKANYGEILNAAVQIPVAEFKDKVTQTLQARRLGSAEPGTDAGPTWVQVSIRVLPEIRDRWQAIMNASGLPAEKLFAAMMDEYVKTHPLPTVAPKLDALLATA